MGSPARSARFEVEARGDHAAFKVRNVWEVLLRPSRQTALRIAKPPALGFDAPLVDVVELGPQHVLWRVLAEPNKLAHAVVVLHDGVLILGEDPGGGISIGDRFG